MIKGKFDYSQFEEFVKKVDTVAKNDEKINEFMNGCTKELAARLLALVIPKTPVGDYRTEIEVTAKRDSKYHKKGEKYKKKVNKSGKVGGTLRRGWTAKTEEEAKSGSGKPTAQDGRIYAQSLQITKKGNTYSVEIVNPVHYASYVENGHATRDRKSYVLGKFMLTVAEKELQDIAPKVLEQKLDNFLKEIFDGL